MSDATEAAGVESDRRGARFHGVVLVGGLLFGGGLGVSRMARPEVVLDSSSSRISGCCS